MRALTLKPTNPSPALQTLDSTPKPTDLAKHPLRLRALPHRRRRPSHRIRQRRRRKQRLDLLRRDCTRARGRKQRILV